MSYEGHIISKDSSRWILSDPEGEHIGIAKTKRECLGFLAKAFLEDDQCVLADAYQEKMREQGDDNFSYLDALNALIHEASSNSKHFIEVLRPDLWKRFNANGQAVFDVEIIK